MTDQSARIVAEAKHIVKTGDTVRKTALLFGVGKSTVHKDVAARLREIDIHLFYEVETVLGQNLAVRHLRGGKATKEKYLREKGENAPPKSNTGAKF